MGASKPGLHAGEQNEEEREMQAMSWEQRNVLAHRVLFLVMTSRPWRDIAGTVKWKGVQIVQQRESPQLPTSMGLLTGLDFLLDLRSFFTYCDGWLDYRYREFNNYHLKLTEMQNNVKFCSFLCYNPSKNSLRAKPNCTGLHTYDVLNAFLLMCVFNLLWFCLVLIKVLAALWNILWFFKILSQTVFT